MERAGPPVILVDGQGEMIHLSTAAGRFLAFSTGELTRDLLQAVHPALQAPLSAVLERARVSQRPEAALSSSVHLHGEPQTVFFRVSPLEDTLPGHLLVSFEAHPVHPPPPPKANAEESGTAHVRVEAEHLRRQFDDLRAQHAAAAQKHQADTEELRAMNEELRLASEELEVGREEFQTLNEELTAANRTLEGKVNELGHANGDLRNLMAATAIATVFLNRELRITRYTPTASALFRIIENDVGRPLAHLRHEIDYSELQTDAARVLARLIPVEREIAGNNGECFLVRLLPYRTTDERIAGVVLTCVNITERKQAEAQRLAQEAAERINKARSEFLSRMSHELRTPLNAILGFGQILELGLHDEQDSMAVGLILKAGRHLLSLIDEVLDLTQAEGGELRLAFGALDLKRLVRECVLLTARLAEARQITCEGEESDPSLPPLWTDEQRLRQVLLNLLSNAIKYNRRGGRVSLSCRRAAEDQCLISVRDTGLGIAADDIPRLFTPFERLHHQDGEIEGTGLGLAITRRLVEALGGSIGVESEPGRGSRFWVKLPFGHAPAEVAEAPGILPLPSAGDATAKRDLTLLCIEDNASNLELVQMVAASQWPDWQFLSARTGAAGLEQATQHRPGLILLDLQLPDHPGGWVLAALRRDPRTSHLPVIVLSADATVHSREQLLAAGAAEFVTKPFQIGDLVQAVNRTLRLSAP